LCIFAIEIAGQQRRHNERVHDVSDEIARRSGVRHQSPQAILLREGKPVWDASHIGITVDSLLAAIKQTNR
jgi:bacillithiol system protein YtxJ